MINNKTRKCGTKYEIHVNGYEVNQELESRILDLGFFKDPFLQTGTRYTPPHHFTFVVHNDPATRTNVWNETLKIIKNDAAFRGYIESETVPEEFRKLFENPSEYDSALALTLGFPLPFCKTIEVPIGKNKAADIHVKRGLNWERDSLDDLLLKNNFYEVHTPRNRIFTFQTETFNDAREAYLRLRDYFSKVHGVKQVDLEITGKFYRIPKDFPVARIVPKGMFD